MINYFYFHGKDISAFIFIAHDEFQYAINE